MKRHWTKRFPRAARVCYRALDTIQFIAMLALIAFAVWLALAW